MAGRGDPPEGTPDGVPGGDDDDRDEYRSMVFDESFVEAARIQEYSARERLEDEEHAAVRRRSARSGGSEDPEGPDGFEDEGDGGGWPRNGGVRSRLGASKQGIVLVLLIVAAFGTAIYMGIRTPYQAPAQSPTPPMRSAMLPLAPRDAVPGGSPADLYAHSPAAQFRTGAEGVTLAPAKRTAHFTASQVLSALTTAKDYVVRSSLDPKVITGDAVRTVRSMIDPAQHRQFDRSLDDPRTDGRHAATGWMIRFDQDKVALADPEVRVNGELKVREVAGNALEITADHVFVYAVRSAANADEGREKGAGGDASLFTVRREVRFHFDQKDLRRRQLSVEQVSMRAGPLPCSTDPSGTMTPLLAGEKAKDDISAGTDPYARGRSSASMCGVLSSGAQPNPHKS